MSWAWKIGKLAGIDVTCTHLPAVSGVHRRRQLAESHNARRPSRVFLCWYRSAASCCTNWARTHGAAPSASAHATLFCFPSAAWRASSVCRDPNQELLVALAGPAVNVLIPRGFSRAAVMGRIPRCARRDDQLTGPDFLPSLMAVNVWLVLFNLIPAFPMDGGRVLRACWPSAWTTRTPRRRLRISARDRFCFRLGLFSTPSSLYCSLRVDGASARRRRCRCALRLWDSCAAGMYRIFARFNLMTRWQRLWSKSFRLAQDFPVVYAARARRTAQKTCAGNCPGRTDKHVRDAMRRDFQFVDSHDMLEQAVQMVQRCGCRALPVDTTAS